MSTKYYRVTQDNFMWHKGAILVNNAHGGDGYMPVDGTDIWDMTDNQNEYISDRMIESNPVYFERVYQVNLLSRTLYKLKEEAREVMEKQMIDESTS